MSFMFFADEDEVPLPPREVHIIETAVELLLDQRRVALSVTLTPFLEYPNLEIVLFRPDGQEERTLSIIGAMDRHLNLTMHIARPVAGEYCTRIDLIYEGEVLQTETVKFVIPQNQRVAGS